ncbi:unnamed protein product [Effrenium voratum]|uniref:Uncharacterized protein n=1 Tax=Effrenium voratum TaxID=2562239 RepID=A0AA36MQ22_9DINO|nr:unnamed protein product [Effrenium voratum]CAJ1433903.1 unnamed protein product [Effrenium voratum]
MKSDICWDVWSAFGASLPAQEYPPTVEPLKDLWHDLCQTPFAMLQRMIAKSRLHEFAENQLKAAVARGKSGPGSIDREDRQIGWGCWRLKCAQLLLRRSFSSPS